MLNRELCKTILLKLEGMYSLGFDEDYLDEYMYVEVDEFDVDKTLVFVKDELDEVIYTFELEYASCNYIKTTFTWKDEMWRLHEEEDFIKL